MQPSSSASSSGGGRKRTTKGKGRALGVAAPIQKRNKPQPQQRTSSNKRRPQPVLGCGGSNDEISPSEEVIWFYDENRPWGEFSNFYGKKQDRRFSLVIDGQEWKTTEHYFQAHKFLPPNASPECKEYAALVASQSTPNKAAVLARQRTGGGYKWRTDLNPIIQEYLDKGAELREDWDEVCEEIMEKALHAKFSQNQFLKEVLLSTEDKQLVEHTSRDCYWADGGDGSGENALGRLLMKVRAQLQQQEKEQEN